MQDIDSLRTLVDEIHRSRGDLSPHDYLGHARSVGPRIDETLRGLDTLAAVEEHTDVLIEAARLMQATDLAEVSGDGALQDPHAGRHAEHLTALGLASGDPDLVFQGKANQLVTEIMQTTDRDAAERMLDLAEWLVVHPLRMNHEPLNQRIVRALDHLDSLLARPLDPALAAVDEEVATWIAAGPAQFNEDQVDRIVELIADRGEDLDLEAVQTLFDAAMSVLDPADKSIGTLVDRFRIAYEYYVALRFVDRAAAYQVLALAAAPLHESRQVVGAELLGEQGLAAVDMGTAGYRAAHNSPQWRPLLESAKETLLGGDGDVGKYIDALIHEGEFLAREDNPRDAFTSLNHAYSLARRERFLPAQVVASTGLARLYFLRSMHRDAANLFIDILTEYPQDTLTEKSDRLGYAMAELELALMHRFAGSHTTYEEMLGRAVTTMEELGLHRQVEQARAR